MKMSSKFTCRFCKEQFDIPKGLYKHLQTAHNAGASRDNRTCPICGVLCSKYEGYRDHLLYIHGQTNDGQKLTFKSLNEFLLWKTELEIKHNCKYVLQSAPKVLPTKEKKYFYQCDRSDSKSKDKRDKKATSVVMKTCSSVISVVEGTGLFKVEYWDTHSGHSESSTVQLTQNELEAAISSVEMVNAIDSEDSFDRSASLILSNNSNSSVSIVEKPNILQKANLSSNLNKLKTSPVSNAIKKTQTSLLTGKIDNAKKKTSNTSILYSLASVACGKGIAKKPANKLNAEKIVQVDASLNTSISTTPEKTSENEPMKEKNVLAQPTSFCTVTSSAVTCTVTTVPSLSITTKASTGPPAIAPKVTMANSNAINPLYSSNSAFSNQLVIVNPMNLDQNSMNSGQNILLSLGPIGQNVLPNSTTSPTTASKDKSSVSGGNISLNKVSTLGKTKMNASKILTSSTNATSSVTSPSVSSSGITLPAGINNAPVILSSLPVGSTFMSVNNNLIPIASPSGAFIPTSLPPNIVLTPVLQNSTQTGKDTKSSASAVITPQSSQVRFPTPSTLSITVSSIVKEPVYTYSSVKNLNSTLTTSISSPLPASALANSKVADKGQFKFVPITVASSLSPLTSVNRSVNSKLTPNHSFPDSMEIMNSDASESSEEKSIATTPKKNPSARKRITNRPVLPVKPPGFATRNTLPAKNISLSTPAVTPSVPNLGMKLNSQLSLTPISSAPSAFIKSQQTSKPFNQPLLFESSGDVYMLQPIENDPVANSSSTIVSIPEISKPIKIDRSVQTTETSNAVALKSKLQRKRAAPPTDDSAVMLKVKCYQLEMKYLSSQTECKRLKVELTKEKLKNAELSGESANINMEEDRLSECNRNKAQEIMKEIEDKFSGNKDEQHVYTMTKTSVLRSLYEDLERLCNENGELHKELENYRAHDKFYKNLKKRLDDEDF